MRQFRDAAGVEWRVYRAERNADADQRRDHLLPVEYREGWLVFETATEKRRLAPVPEGWNERTDEALAALCASAAVQTRRANGANTRSIGEARRSDGEPRADATDRESDSQVVSDLHAVEETLTETLDEVCAGPAVEKLDTGELIRVEETLSIAATAAREAISLRRRRPGTGSGREEYEDRQEEHHHY